MHNEARVILEHIFQKSSLQEVSVEELRVAIEQHPYVNSLHFLLAKKKIDSGGLDSENGLKHPALFFSNPLWLEYLLQQPLAPKVAEPVSEEQVIGKPELESQPVNEPVNEVAETQSSAQPQAEFKQPVLQSSANAPLEFEPYHTIDYFASQGIRLQAADLSKDKFGQQLKSFTEWLKSMKRIEEPSGSAPADVQAQENVVRIAEHSIESKEVYTEAMAEVWAKQGNVQKAGEIYHKLSLLNPAKSAYFAAKIEQLKS